MKKIHFLLISSLVAGSALLSVSCTEKENRVNGTGTIEALEVDVTALQSGRINQLSVQAGDQVSKGQQLAELEHDILNLELKQAQSRVTQAQAQLDLLLAGGRKEDIQQAQAGLEQAAQNRDLARKEWERIKTLYAEGSITGKEYDSTETRYKTTQAQYDAAKAALEKAKNTARPQEITKARAEGETGSCSQS